MKRLFVVLMVALFAMLFVGCPQPTSENTNVPANTNYFVGTWVGNQPVTVLGVENARRIIIVSELTGQVAWGNTTTKQVYADTKTYGGQMLFATTSNMPKDIAYTYTNNGLQTVAEFSISISANIPLTIQFNKNRDSFTIKEVNYIGGVSEVFTKVESYTPPTPPNPEDNPHNVDLTKFPTYVNYSGSSIWNKFYIDGWAWQARNVPVSHGSGIVGTATKTYELHSVRGTYAILHYYQFLRPNEYGTSLGLAYGRYHVYDKPIEYHVDFNGSDMYIWLSDNEFGVKMVKATDFNGTSFEMGGITYTRKPQL